VTDLVDIQLADSSVKTPDAQHIRGWVAAVFTTLERSPLALTVRVVGEEEMAKLNQRYRGQNQSTNVLSFPIEPLPDIRTDLLGDIVVCGPVVDREAAIQHKSPIGHWAHMVVHGLLHLFGYDHESDQDATTMEGLEKSVLEGLGYSDPYQGEHDNSTDSRA
jgi:probable rRNA maturation factor